MKTCQRPFKSNWRNIHMPAKNRRPSRPHCVYVWMGIVVVQINGHHCVLTCIETLMFKNEAFVRDFLQKMKLWSSKNIAFVRDFLQKWSFEGQKRSFCARLPWKMQLWSSKTKLLCETSFKNEALKFENKAFLRDFLQKWSFEPQKRSFCARLPSKMKLWSSKTKLLCETSFKNEALKFENKAFLRDFLQKWSFEDQKRYVSARLPSKMTCWPETWPQNSNTF